MTDAPTLAENTTPAKSPPSSKNTMFNYFSKLPSKDKVIEDENPRKLAPRFNKQHIEQFLLKQVDFDTEIASISGGQSSSDDYISCLKSGSHKPHKVPRINKGSLRARLMQFSEDVRPPYFGTWQKHSRLVTGRRPFGVDTNIFNYEVDSEAEWDLGGPGESLKGDDSEDEDELDDYEIDMKTFVPHGYVSDDELEAANSDNDENAKDSSINESDSIKTNCDVVNNDDSDSDVKIIGESDIIKQKAQQNRQQQQQQQQAQPKQTPKMDIKPIIVGLYFEENPTISQSKIQFLKNFEGVSCT